MIAKTLDPLTIVAIQNRVDDQVTVGSMFTAYDVSVAVQDSGHRERHVNMKHVVHEMWDGGEMTGYDRTLIPTPAGVDAWLYHPKGADISGYKPQARRGVAQSHGKPMSVQDFYGQGKAMPPSGIATSPAVVDDDEDDGDAWKPDARGSLTVPAATLRAIGCSPGDCVRVFNDGGNVMVEKTAAAADDDYVYTVNTNLNARITKGTLEKVQAKQGPNGYEFEVIHCGATKRIQVKTAG